MAQTIPQIRSDIETTKEHLSQTMNEIEDRIHELKDWKATVREYPIPSVAVSFGLGLLITARKELLMKLVRANTKRMVTAALSAVVMKQIDKAITSRQS